jgi:hypothetical protein
MESGEWWCTFVKFPSEIFNNFLSRIQKDFKKPKKMGACSAKGRSL